MRILRDLRSKIGAAACEMGTTGASDTRAMVMFCHVTADQRSYNINLEVTYRMPVRHNNVRLPHICSN